ncbi:sugar phosphate isomerase/epimerase family protein [Lichenibacterium dinghuense]|uniref:sugar phosphate isomerase/epimerase family protein n=1 Tax=Lichenibacterium dinghuense TaxID=2895977 RepID=UPI001F1BEFD1|nr:sugar phosphate isomerase/epimerase family protein [Lichenibacterium sp. 6Y81]
MRPVSISAAPYDGYPFAQVCDSLAACGARHVEPAYIVGYTEPFDEASFGAAQARSARAAIDASGLGCHAVSSHIDLGRDDAVAVFKGRMDFAVALGARVINTNAAHRSRASRFRANIGPLAEYAAALGLVIGLENPGNGEDNLMNDAAEGLALLRELDLPSVRLNYDLGNTASHRPGRIDAAADAVAALPGCAHFHLKDVRREADGWHFAVPGQGDIDCGAIMPALAERPDLPFAVELPLRLHRGPDAKPIRASEPVPLGVIEAAVRDSLAFVRRWIPNA